MYDLEPWKAPRRPNNPGDGGPPPPPGSPPDANNLRYRSNAARDELGENECTIVPISPGFATLIFCFRRVTDGQLERRRLPVRPNGEPVGDEHPWGLKRTEHPGRWQITPSILCWDHVADPENPGGPAKRVEVWHHTPAITDVPDGEPWQRTSDAPDVAADDVTVEVVETSDLKQALADDAATLERGEGELEKVIAERAALQERFDKFTSEAFGVMAPLANALGLEAVQGEDVGAMIHRVSQAALKALEVRATPVAPEHLTGDEANAIGNVPTPAPPPPADAAEVPPPAETKPERVQ